MVASALSKSVWLRIRWIALWCCLFFTVSAFAQFYFSTRQLHQKVEDELKRWGTDIAEQLGRQEKWNLRRYNQITPRAPRYVILTNADFIDVYGFVPGLIKQAVLASRVASDRPETVTTAAGAWRIYAKTLADGYVILGIADPEEIKSPDQELQENASKFGSSLAEALMVMPHDTTGNISFAVLDAFSNLRSGIGPLPLRTAQSILEHPERTTRLIEAFDGRRYRVLYEPLFDLAGKQIGLVIIPKDVELEERIARNQFGLIIIVTGITWSFFIFQVLYSLKKAEEEKNAMKRAFAGYFSPPVLEAILKDPKSLGLSGERREVSILFADLRSFTSLSEGLPPKRLTELLQEYFSMMTAEILATDGVVDKFIGDAIMAFWGAPIDQLDKADRAVTAALNMVKRLSTLNDKWEKEGSPPLEIGIGVNTGVAIVGNMGSRTRFDYTLIGDEVNIASRLEGLNKRFGSNILISESTRRSLTIPVELEPLGETEIRGRQEPIRVYKVNV